MVLSPDPDRVVGGHHGHAQECGRGGNPMISRGVGIGRSPEVEIKLFLFNVNKGS